MTRCGDEEKRLFQLDNRLPDLTDPEMLSRPPGQALHAGGQRRKMLGVLAAQVLRGRDGEPVPGQDHGLPEMLDAFAEVVEEPAQLLAWSGKSLLVHNVSSPCGASESCRPAPCAVSAGFPSRTSLSRPRCQPLCKEATRLRASSGLRVRDGGVPSVSAARAAARGLSRKCGFRFAWRTRRGRPR